MPLSAPHGDQKVRLAEDPIQAGHVPARSPHRHLRVSPGSVRVRWYAGSRRREGACPGAYVGAFRISVARQLLEETTDTVQTVGEAVGYDDVAFFRQFFRRHIGMAPADSRARFGHSARHTAGP